MPAFLRVLGWPRGSRRTPCVDPAAAWTGSMAAMSVGPGHSHPAPSDFQYSGELQSRQGIRKQRTEWLGRMASWGFRGHFIE